MTTKEKQEQNTKNFFNAYYVRKQMSTVSGYDEDEDMTTSFDKVKEPTKKQESPIEVGQIRSFEIPKEYAKFYADKEFLVLQEWEPGEWLIVPISAIEFPAHAEEFECAGNVYQLNYPCVINESKLTQGFKLGTVSDNVINQVKAGVFYMISGCKNQDNMPDDFDDHVGVSTIKERDSHDIIEYAKNETSIINSIVQTVSC